jgi:hypothetical protein
MQAPPADMPRPIEPSEPPTSNIVSGNLPVPAKMRRRRLPVLTWIGLSVVVLVAAAVVVQGRDAIVAQWPYAERLYRAAGFADQASRVEEQGSDTATNTTGGG